MLRNIGIALGLLLASSSAIAQFPGEPSALPRGDCERACLESAVEAYVAALRRRDPSRAPFAPNMRFTENSVEMPVGEGLWATVTSVATDGMKASDPQTGNVAWFGHAEEHGRTVFLAIRLKVDKGLISEAETVLARRTGMPLIFGTGKEPHLPGFSEALPVQQRRPRERLQAVADSYFDTVELNDGQVFAHFHEDCARLENGISTTAAGAGAAAVAQGCEDQFKLGIYRINKRLRERRFPLIDEERGIVVGTTFFDHANTFDEYTLTDGRTMKTLLKWPNSLSIMEAFRIVDGKIKEIEAVFDYVPYAMHSPWVGPAAAVPSPVAAARSTCAEACLLDLADRTIAAIAAKDYRKLPWADPVRFSENEVSLMIGDGLWGSTGKNQGRKAFAVADATTGNVVWFGTIWDHDDPALGAIRIKAPYGRIEELEVLAARSPGPLPIEEKQAFEFPAKFSQPLGAADRRPRERLVDLADNYLATRQGNNGELLARFTPDCRLRENGLPAPLAIGEVQAPQADCAALFRQGQFAPLERVRDRRFPAVDEARGLVVAISVQDLPAREPGFRTTDGNAVRSKHPFPMSRTVAEVVRIEADAVAASEGITVYLPYRMPTPWK